MLTIRAYDPCMRSAQVIAAALFLALAVHCRAEQRAFDILNTNYAPYCVPGDDLAFPMKIWALSANQYQFWRGSRDLYFTWCRDRDQGGDWLADKGSYVVNHGDLHLGNIGRYAKNGIFGSTSFGAVDFDETARLPFQIELLQGMITFQLAARENNIDLGGRRERLARVLYDSYKNAVASDKNTLQLVTDEHSIGKFIEQAQKHTYEKTLLKFTDDSGHFLRYVHTKHSDEKAARPRRFSARRWSEKKTWPGASPRRSPIPPPPAMPSATAMSKPSASQSRMSFCGRALKAWGARV
jgi:uncharacterized protein (DUF2252 family)